MKIKILSVNYLGDEERVVIGSFASEPRNLKGYQLYDIANHWYTFPSFILQPNRTVSVWTKSGQDDDENLYMGQKNSIWNNDGNLAVLVNKRRMKVSENSVLVNKRRMKVSENSIWNNDGGLAVLVDELGMKVSEYRYPKQTLPLVQRNEPSHNPPSQEPIPKKSPRIIHISDLHFSDSRTTWEVGGFLGLIDFQDSTARSYYLSENLIFNKKVFDTDLILITGDITDSGDEGDYKIAADFINKLKNKGYAVHVCPGNHDYCYEGMLSKFPFGGKSNERRKRFNQYVKFKGYPSGQQDYPYYMDYGNLILIVLDSMKAQMDEDTGDKTAQGKLGNAQLSRLEEIVNRYQDLRAKGEKYIVVGLHHSPFEGKSDLLLRDKQQLMSILSNRVDCLLFGHTTPNGVLQDSYREWEKSYGIPLINCENLEHGNDQRLPISVIDLKQNHVEVYSSYLTNTVPIIQRGYKNIKGKYHIVQPIVNTGARIYYNGIAGKEEIEFRSGDKVTIKAGGGVQTGGSGQTWKRYVNPSGTNSNRLYFGKVFIPGITPSLTAFRDLVYNYGKYTQPHECTLQFTIPSFTEQPFLMLQYVDDNYSDNGYWGHDDGTENQCRGVGEAYVVIKIERMELV